MTTAREKIDYTPGTLACDLALPSCGHSMAARSDCPCICHRDVPETDADDPPRRCPVCRRAKYAYRGPLPGMPDECFECRQFARNARDASRQATG